MKLCEQFSRITAEIWRKNPSDLSVKSNKFCCNFKYNNVVFSGLFSLFPFCFILKFIENNKTFSE